MELSPVIFLAYLLHLFIWIAVSILHRRNAKKYRGRSFEVDALV